MISTKFTTVTLLFISIMIASTNSYVPALITKRSTMTMRKGRKSLKKTINNGLGGGPSNVKPMAAENTMSQKTNWVPVAGLSSMSDLPQKENEVQLVETNAPQLQDARTNPNGAVSVVNYEGKTYCFSSSCSSCKIPLTKAKLYEPNEETDGLYPRLACDFCGATFNVRTGEKVSDVGGKGGLFGGVIKGLMGAKPSDKLPTYDLGEKNGEVLINLP